MMSLQIVGLAVVLFGVSANACFCTADYKPYCGTDGKTYSNKCELECAVTRGNPNLRVKFEGVCAVSYEPEKGSRTGNRNQLQNQRGAESRQQPKYIQPPRYQNQNSRPNYQQGNKNFQQTQSYYPTASPQKQYPTPGYPTVAPPRNQYYPTPKQTYYPTPTVKPYQPPKQTYYPTPTVKPYQPPKQTYYPTPKQTYYPTPTVSPYQPPKQSITIAPPPRQNYYQPPTVKPSYQQQQSWVPTYGGRK